jgi:hypothetical protein
MNTHTPEPLPARLKRYLVDRLDPDDHPARAAAAELLEAISQALSEAAHHSTTHTTHTTHEPPTPNR